MPLLIAGVALVALAYGPWIASLPRSAWTVDLVARLALALGVWIAAVVYELSHEARIGARREQIWVAGSLMLFVSMWSHVRVPAGAPPWSPLVAAAVFALLPVVLGSPERPPGPAGARMKETDARAAARAWRPVVLVITASWFGGSALLAVTATAKPMAVGKSAFDPRRGRTAEVLRAANEGDVARVTTTLARDAGVARRASDGAVTPLHVACARGRAEMVATLIAHGADVNARDAAGATPVHYAVQARADATLIWRLLTRKPDLSIRNEHGQTPIDLAEAMGQGEIAAQLRRGAP